MVGRARAAQAGDCVSDSAQLQQQPDAAQQPSSVSRSPSFSTARGQAAAVSTLSA